MSGSVRDSGCNSPGRLGRVLDLLTCRRWFKRARPVLCGHRGVGRNPCPRSIRVSSGPATLLFAHWSWWMIHLRCGGLSKMRRVASAASAALIVPGCASKASDIAPSYVSPIQYDAYNRQQLVQEAQRISAHAAEAAGAQDSQATREQ
jgi:hypothetical protein